MSNSSLICYTKISPNKTSPRRNAIKKITIHHMAGNLSVESCGEVFAPSSRQASSNYGIGTDGRIGMYVEEKDRAWTSSNADNDNQAVTIEVANDTLAPNWTVSEKAMVSLINLCVDICKRNGIDRLIYTGDKTGNLTMHKWFAATGCPGPYLESKFQYIADEVNKLLGSSSSDYEEKPKDEPIICIKAGDKVKVQSGATYYGGKTVPAWVAAKEWIVREVSGDRAVINKSVDGQNAINSPINTKYLTVIGGSASSDTFTPYLVRINTDVLNVRKGPSTDTAITCTVKRNEVFTIVGEQSGWGKLKSGAGWIKLSYAVRK